MTTYSGTSYGQGTGVATGWGGGRRPRRSWRPPTRPPAGRYDPALDAQVRASDRGYHDLQQDTSRDQGRLLSDFNINTTAVDARTNSALADAFTSGTRLTQDYGRQTGRLGEDYSRQTGDLQRNVQQLGDQQASQANAQGVLDPSSAQAALQARAVNQRRDQGLIDQTRDRSLQDMTTSKDRGLADLLTGANRAVYAGNTAKGNLGLALTRGNEDLSTALSRGGREHTAFGLDTNAQRFYNARAGGWVPPRRPRGRRR